MNRIVVTRHILGIRHMQVCAEKDVTDKEILEVCNKENVAGTTHGWVDVIREGENKPVKCKEDPNRLHFLAAC